MPSVIAGDTEIIDSAIQSDTYYDSNGGSKLTQTRADQAQIRDNYMAADDPKRKTVYLIRSCCGRCRRRFCAKNSATTIRLDWVHSTARLNSIKPLYSAFWVRTPDTDSQIDELHYHARIDPYHRARGIALEVISISNEYGTSGRFFLPRT